MDYTTFVNLMPHANWLVWLPFITLAVLFGTVGIYHALKIMVEVKDNPDDHLS